jgi:phosphoribulokinase
MSGAKDLTKERPTEIVSGLTIAGLVYGFLTQADVNNAVAALIGLALGPVPIVVSEFIDGLRRDLRERDRIND